MSAFSNAQWAIIRRLQACICQLSSGGDTPIVINNALGNGSVVLSGNGTTGTPLYGNANFSTVPTIYTASGLVTGNRVVNMSGVTMSFSDVIGGSKFDVNFIGGGDSPRLLVDNTVGSENVYLGVPGITGAPNLAITQATTILKGQVGVVVLSTNVTINGATADIQLQTAGTTKATVANNGRVGIGTTAPIGKLHISTGTSAITSSGPNNGILLTDNTTFCRFYMENTSAPTGQRVFALDNTNGVFSLSSYNDTANAAVVANIFSITSAGLVTLSSLVGTGSRQVVTAANGTLSAGAAVPLTGSSPALTFDPVPAGGELDLGFNIAGAAIGDVVALGIPASVQTQSGVVFTAMVSNTNVITIRCTNVTAAPISLPAGIFKATVFK